jgi:hypothetical protein
MGIAALKPARPATSYKARARRRNTHPPLAMTQINVAALETRTIGLI